MTVARKLLTPTLLGITLAIAVLVIINLGSQTRLIVERENARLAEAHATFNAIIDDRGKLAQALATSIVDMPEIKKTFAERRREDLLDLVQPIYRELTVRYRVVDLAFHLPSGKSFLRSNLPHAFGDDLTADRPTVVRANLDKSPQSGLEVDATGIAIRGVVPVAYQGRYIGSAEFGIGLESYLLEQFKARMNADIAIYLSEDALHKASLNPIVHTPIPGLAGLVLIAKTGLAANLSSEQYGEVLHGTKILERIDVEEKHYVVSAVPLHNADGGIIGVIQIGMARGNVLRAMVASRNTSLIWGGAICALTLLIIFVLVNRTITIPLASLTKSAGRLQAGDRTARVEIGGKDEMGQLGSAFNAMADELEGLVSGLERRIEERTGELIEEIGERKQAEQALRESEELYRSFFENSMDGILVTDHWGQILAANPEACRMFQRSAAEMCRLQQVDLVDHTDKRAAAFFDNRNHTYRGEIIHIRRDGGRFPAELSCAPFSDQHGQQQSITILRDVATRKQLEAEILRSQKIESVGLLAGGIAHDFNNMLTAILGNISLAKLAAGDNRQAKWLGDAEKASLMAKGLTMQLLAFARGGAPVKELSSLADVVRDASTISLRGSNVRSELAIPDDLWPVEIDPGQIGQVIQNLVLNADQAMPRGGVISIVCSNVTVDDQSLPLKPGDYVEMEIGDQGVGIPENELGQIFEPYFTTKAKGRGLGLASVHTIVKNHDGHIAVQSQSGVGSAFRVWLPASCRKIEPPKQELAAISAGKGRILIMDDEEMVRDLLHNMLVLLGYEVASAQDGQEAIALYRQALASGNPFTLVITDLTIPGGLGGVETIEALRRLDPGVRAIVSSGYSNNPVMADYRQYGYIGVIPKPYRIDELSDILRKTIDDTGRDHLHLPPQEDCVGDPKGKVTF